MELRLVLFNLDVIYGLVLLDILHLLLLILMLHLLLLLHLAILHAFSRDPRASSSLLNEFGVEQHKAFVHDLQGGGHLFVVTLKLNQNLLRLLFGQLNQKRLRRLHVEGRDEEVRRVRGNLDDVVTLAELFAAFVVHHPVFVQVLGLSDYWVPAWLASRICRHSPGLWSTSQLPLTAH